MLLYFGVVTHRISRSNARFVGKKRTMFHHHKEKASNIIQGWKSYKSNTWVDFLSNGIGQVRICMHVADQFPMTTPVNAMPEIEAIGWLQHA